MALTWDMMNEFKAMFASLGAVLERIADAAAAYTGTGRTEITSIGGLEVGTTYVFFVPPGWLLGGTVVAIKDGHAILRNCVYLEGVASGKATVSDLPIARTAAAQREVARTHWGMPDKTFIRVDAILFANPCNADFSALAQTQNADAIRGA